MLDSPIELVQHSGQIQEIKSIVDEFLELKRVGNYDELRAKTSILDEKIRNLDLVKQYCEKEISSFELIQSPDPYDVLQSKCSKLKQISLTKAYEIWKIFT